ncbi:MAG: HAD family phosphatase [Lachnospiraceae bacterium]|nr:HAD family phosphatase [Lachnospiraceae bacterium]
MIKLIATDVDDTLLPNATPSITPEIEDMINRLYDKGIIFVVATGRQYEGVKNTFLSVKDKIIFVCENGAAIYLPGEEAIFKTIPMDYARGIIRDYRKYRNREKNWQGIDFLVSTSRGVFIEHPTKEFEHLVGVGMNYRYHVLDSFEELEEDEQIFKISLYSEDGVMPIFSDLAPRWRNKVNMCQGGKTWLPSMNIEADKGVAISRIAKKFNIKPEEMMAFGDGGNDIGMFKKVKYSYAAENAESFVKKEAFGIFEPATKGGVYKVIMKTVFGE